MVFLRVPPSPYCSFHCWSSNMLPASDATLDLTCKTGRSRSMMTLKVLSQQTTRLIAQKATRARVSEIAVKTNTNVNRRRHSRLKDLSYLLHSLTHIGHAQGTDVRRNSSFNLRGLNAGCLSTLFILVEINISMNHDEIPWRCDSKYR